jgi:hypothetical protein
VHGRHRVEVQDLGQLGAVDLVVLPLGAVDQPQLAGVRHPDHRGHLGQLVVQRAVAARRLVADRERRRDLLQLRQQVRARAPDVEPLEKLPVAVKNIAVERLGVGIQSDVVHSKPPFGW